MIFPLHMIGVLKVTGNHSKISSFTLVWICISSSSMTLIFISLNLLYLLPHWQFQCIPYLFKEAKRLMSESSGSEGRERGREERRERDTKRRSGREEGEQRWQARTCGEVLPHFNPNIPATECALCFPVPRNLFILFSLSKVASFPLNSHFLFRGASCLQD